jgi:acetyl esterase
MQNPVRSPRSATRAKSAVRAHNTGMPRTLRATRPDRDTRALLRALKLSVRPPEAYSLRQLRVIWRLVALAMGRRLAVASVSEQLIDGPGGPIALRVYAASPSAELRPAFLWCHGGGFMLGGLDSADPICRNIARTAGCVVIAVRYRLSPEHDLSAGREDFLAALDWVAQQGKTLGIDTTRLAIGGDSAGGNICAAVAQARHGHAALRLQVLAYPATDLLHQFPSEMENAAGFLMTAGLLDHIKRIVVIPPHATQPWFSPRRHADLQGLAPALIVTAGYDPIRDDGLDYAARLRAAGVPVELLHYAGQIHGFLSFDAVIGAGRHALQHLGEALVAAFRAEPAANRTLEVGDRDRVAGRQPKALCATGGEVTSTLLFASVSFERWSDTLARLLSHRATDVFALALRPWLAPARFVRQQVIAQLDRLAVRQTYPEVRA